MNKKTIAMISSLLIIGILNIPKEKKEEVQGINLAAEKKQFVLNSNSNSNKQVLNGYAKEIYEYKERIRLEQERKQNAHNQLSRGFTYSSVKRVKCKITYYCNFNDAMEGGQHDKKGKLLTSHHEPVVALPKNVPYGSYLILDKNVNGNNIYKCVDSGGAIKWLDENTMKVDVFIPNVTPQWIEQNLENKIIEGYLFIK